MKTYKVVIAEDHSILRNELRSLLSSMEGIKVVAEAEDGIEAVQYAEKHKPGCQGITDILP